MIKALLKRPAPESFREAATAAKFDMSFVDAIFDKLPDNRLIKDIDVFSSAGRFNINTLRPVIPRTTLGPRKKRPFLKCELMDCVSKSDLPMEISFSKLVAGPADINVPEQVSRFRIEPGENGKPVLYEFSAERIAKMVSDNHDRQSPTLEEDLQTIEYQ